MSVMSQTRSVLAIMLLAVCGCAPAASTGTKRGPVHPVFSERFLGIDGHETTLANVPAEIVVVHFWASWCSACVYEMQSLSKLSAAVGNPRVKVVALAVDDTLPAVKQLKLPGTSQILIGLDHMSTIRGWARVGSLPTTVITDGNGALLSFPDPESGDSTRKVEGVREWNSPALVEFLKKQVDPAGA